MSISVSLFRLLFPLVFHGMVRTDQAFRDCSLLIGSSRQYCLQGLMGLSPKEHRRLEFECEHGQAHHSPYTRVQVSA
ncbi:hypothetical protein EDB92DRAFT_1861026 [Lactarius akahatsu]|uniref:Secreted protein n=1 Tax=Lactarius akahatsu TaxID=416441 RepID=A0AAD4LJJ9_9AGAM|nr:hypothetical protein EDB92DRAFT_1861026 [Lactarius akahatsu]